MSLKPFLNMHWAQSNSSLDYISEAGEKNRLVSVFMALPHLINKQLKPDPGSDKETRVRKINGF